MFDHPCHPDRAREYLDEAKDAYERAVARGEKQTQLRPRQRDLTEAWMHAILAGVPI